MQIFVKITTIRNGATEDIILSEGLDWSLAIHMGMDDANCCENCIDIFSQLANFLVFNHGGTN